jgi:hypothetical protein
MARGAAAAEAARLADALYEAEASRDGTRADLAAATARLLELEASEVEARHTIETEATRAAAEAEARQALESMARELRGRAEAAEDEVAELRAQAAAQAKEVARGREAEASLEAAKARASHAEERADHAGRRAAAAALEGSAAGGCLGLEVEALERELAALSRGYAHRLQESARTLRHEVSAAGLRATQLEEALHNSEARAIGAERMASEGALAWREQLLVAREQHSSALAAEKVEGKRQWKAKLAHLQAELRAEMGQLAALPAHASQAPDMTELETRPHRDRAEIALRPSRSEPLTVPDLVRRDCAGMMVLPSLSARWTSSLDEVYS